MPHELDRIRKLAGLQQEAAAISPNQIEAFKKWYATYSKMQSKDVYNYAKGIFKAYMETGVTELDGASKQDPNGKAYDDLAKIFPEMDGDIEAIGDALQSQGVDPLDMEAQEESAVQEAEPKDTADDLISTITKLAQDAVEKSNFSDLRLFKAKEPEIQELIKKEPNNDALRQIWNYYPSRSHNSPPKKGGRFGDIDVSQDELQAQHEAMIERLLREIINIGRKHLNLPRYLANFDKPDLTAPQQQGLAALVKKYANRKTYGGGGLIDGYLDYLAQTGVWTDAADGKEFDVALKKLGHKNLAAWEKRAQGEEFEQFLKLAPITAQAQNDVEKVLGKGFENNEELISAASDYVKSLPESAVQPTPVLNAVKETPAISQVDEAIKKATAQLKSFSNFDGLKPYKPKKK